MSVELMAKCARCGDMVPFERTEPCVNSVPGIVFSRLDSKGRIQATTSGAVALCDKCYGQMWKLAFGPGKEDEDA